MADEEQLFAYDLMRFIMNEYSLRWFPVEGSHYNREDVSTTFIPSIGQVVYELSYIRSIFRRRKLVKILKFESFPGQCFEELTRCAASISFHERFSMRNFLKFCTHVTALTVEYFKSGAAAVPYYGFSLIAESLRDNRAAFVTEGGWKALYKESAGIMKRDILVKHGRATCFCL